jgi:hypothetical protein
MKQQPIWVWYLVVGVVFAGLAAAVYYQVQGSREQAPTVAAPPPATQGPAREPVATAPPPPPQPTIPLPPLDESDGLVQSWLTEVFGMEPVERYIVPDTFVRHMVATVDNLTREKVAMRQRPVTPAPGEFLAEGPEDALVLSEKNYDRYTPFVRLIADTDASTFVALYSRLYPLMQQAYEELGNPTRNFNVRMVEVIDHLLETPEIDGPIKLVRPNVFYQFADEDLERRSAGQKLLLRMGAENAAVVKAKLREIREDLFAGGTTSGSPAPAGQSPNSPAGAPPSPAAPTGQAPETRFPSEPSTAPPDTNVETTPVPEPPLEPPEPLPATEPGLPPAP